MNDLSVPSEHLSQLAKNGLLDIYLIDCPPASYSTALERCLTESPSINAAFHEPFTGLSAYVYFEDLHQRNLQFEHALDSILGFYLDIVEQREDKNLKVTLLIKTMANDLSNEQYEFLLGIAKGALTIVRNPQSQLMSFYNSYMRINEGLPHITPHMINSSAHSLHPLAQQLMAKTGNAEITANALNKEFKPHMDLMQMSNFQGTLTDEPAWGSISGHLKVRDRVGGNHLTIQAELLQSAQLCQMTVSHICNSWGIEPPANITATHNENGTDYWPKTAGDRMRSGYMVIDGRPDPFAEKALTSYGWQFRNDSTIPVPQLNTIPQALRDYLLSVADYVYFQCLDRQDMYGPKIPSVLRMMYGEGFNEIADRMENRRTNLIIPQDVSETLEVHGGLTRGSEFPDLSHFVMAGMLKDPQVQAVLTRIGL